MLALGWWFSPGAPKLKSLEISSISSNTNQGIDKVLHSRVSKLAPKKTTSKAPKCEAFARDIKDDEDNEEIRRGIKQEEDDDDDDGDRGSAELPIAFPKAIKAQQIDSENSVTSRPPNPNDSEDDDTSSEAEKDTAWRLEQIYINVVLNARNDFPLMPSSWKMHFRGIPLPDGLYYDKKRSKSLRPRIYAHTDRLEYRGGLILRKLIDVHARIQDIRNDEAVVKNDKGKDEAEKRALIKTISAEIVKQLRRVLEQALDWAKQDGEIDKYGDQLPPNIRVMELNSIMMADEPDSEVKIQTEMCNLAEEWRAYASNGDAPVQVPVIFGFVIMKHIITIVTLDASDPSAIIHVPCQLHMAEKNQHQWNALAILVTICWARDVLLGYINARPDLQPEAKSESSDPDA
ncbi:hypothetical protein F4782DRAFT_527671 [Xylaria castorea]|nr:hypothetical protein F4782DRAFT_527671 [Xylaria castorea]